jgi:hypothetical protein
MTLSLTNDSEGFVEIEPEDVVLKYAIPDSWSDKIVCNCCKSTIILREKYLFICAHDMKKVGFKCPCGSNLQMRGKEYLPSSVYRRILKKNMFICNSRSCGVRPHSNFVFLKIRRLKKTKYVMICCICFKEYDENLVIILVYLNKAVEK